MKKQVGPIPEMQESDKSLLKFSSEVLEVQDLKTHKKEERPRQLLMKNSLSDITVWRRMASYIGNGKILP